VREQRRTNVRRIFEFLIWTICLFLHWCTERIKKHFLLSTLSLALLSRSHVLAFSLRHTMSFSLACASVHAHYFPGYGPVIPLARQIRNWEIQADIDWGWNGIAQAAGAVENPDLCFCARVSCAPVSSRSLNLQLLERGATAWATPTLLSISESHT